MLDEGDLHVLKLQAAWHLQTRKSMPRKDETCGARGSDPRGTRAEKSLEWEGFPVALPLTATTPEHLCLASFLLDDMCLGVQRLPLCHPIRPYRQSPPGSGCSVTVATFLPLRQQCIGWHTCF